MKIFFDNVNFSSSSGPNTFALRLAENLYNRGHEISNVPDCDIHLSFIEQSYPKHPRSKLIQRLDGIWFKPDEFISKNANIKTTYNTADHVIWQTEFDKVMITKHWGMRSGDIIHNGIKLADVDVTDPSLKDLRKNFNKIFVSSANWHRQKRLKENIELFNKMCEYYSNSCLLVLGSHPDHMVRQDNIFYLGNLSKDLLMQTYSIADWMIHLAWLDHCPNTVVEALSLRVPVICTDSGGTKEIVRSHGVVLRESFVYEYQLTDYGSPPPLDLNVDKLPDIIVDPSYLDIDLVVSRYEKCFTRLLSGE